MKTYKFKVNFKLERELNDSELELTGEELEPTGGYDESLFDTDNIKSEIVSWLRDLDFRVKDIEVTENKDA
tara:strand:- start:454 stop:666 length:213 start_codon:yes stop_codon:yes gene_type:complete